MDCFVNPFKYKSSFATEQVGDKYIESNCKLTDCELGLLLHLSMTDFGAQTYD